MNWSILYFKNLHFEQNIVYIEQKVIDILEYFGFAGFAEF